MEKLKTVNELENWMPIAHYPNNIGEPWAMMASNKNEMPPQDEGYYSHTELREEAIKWLKELGEDYSILMSNKYYPDGKQDILNRLYDKWYKIFGWGYGPDRVEHALAGTAFALQYIFNITEEDLSNAIR